MQAHTTKNNYDKEYKLYNKLYETLTQEQKELFDAFIDLYTLNQCEFAENKYIRGFKTGLLLGIECTNLKLWPNDKINFLRIKIQQS